MSEIKIKLIDGQKDCTNCFFYNGHCTNYSYDHIECMTQGKVWVIDEPQSPWVKIEDAELVDGEQYWVSEEFDGEVHLSTFRIFDGASAYFGLGEDKYTLEPDEISHVIHLPKPQPPKL